MRNLQHLAAFLFNHGLESGYITPEEHSALTTLTRWIRNTGDHYWIEAPSMDEILNVNPDGTLRSR